MYGNQGSLLRTTHALFNITSASLRAPNTQHAVCTRLAQNNSSDPSSRCLSLHAHHAERPAMPRTLNPVPRASYSAYGASRRCASTHSACSTVSRTTPSARSSAGAPPPGAPAAARTRSAAAAASAGGRLSSAAASDSSRRCAAGRGVNGANAAASVWQSARKRRALCCAGRS